MGLNNQGWKWKGEEPWKLEIGGSIKDEIYAISDKGSKIIQINWKKDSDFNNFTFFSSFYNFETIRSSSPSQKQRQWPSALYPTHCIYPLSAHCHDCHGYCRGLSRYCHTWPVQWPSSVSAQSVVGRDQQYSIIFLRQQFKDNIQIVNNEQYWSTFDKEDAVNPEIENSSD